MTGRTALRLSPIVLLLVASACGGGGTKPATTSLAYRIEARVYLLRDGEVAPVERLVTGTSRSELLQALAGGPAENELSTGLTSGAAGSRAHLAQVVYTLTQLDPRGSVTVDGKRYTRADFEDETPAILVESPLPFATVRPPVRLTGTSNTYEATFQYELRDAAGKVVAKHFVTATSGNGFRGTYDVTIPFTVAKAGPGTLIVYENDAATGKRVHQVDIPVMLQP